MESINRKHFVSILEGTLGELIELYFECLFDKELLSYLEFMIAYLKGDNLEMIKCYKNLVDNSVIKKTAKLRIELREREINFENLDVILSEVEKDENSILLLGELYFLAARAYSIGEKFILAKDYYHKAIAEFNIIGAKRKGLKAFSNFIAVESKINPKKKLLVEYNLLAKKASELNEYSVAGINYINISREYQLIGAYEIALKYCNQGLTHLENEFGSIHYQLSTAHKCHLLLNMERDVEAEIEFQKVAISTFPEVLEALKVIDVLRSCSDVSNVDMRNLAPTWKDRIEKYGKKISPLSHLENMIVEFLSEGPRGKFEIIDHLYGRKNDIYALENRFKVTMSRLRKKRPSLIVLEDKKYKISDETFMTKEQFTRI